MHLLKLIFLFMFEKVNLLNIHILHLNKKALKE